MRSPALDSGERSPFMTPRSGQCPFEHDVVDSKAWAAEFFPFSKVLERDKKSMPQQG